MGRCGMLRRGIEVVTGEGGLLQCRQDRDHYAASHGNRRFERARFRNGGCGGFQLITHSEAVERYFEPGKEIETFRDLDELRDKVRYYLREAERKR